MISLFCRCLYPRRLTGVTGQYKVTDLLDDQEQQVERKGHPEVSSIGIIVCVKKEKKEKNPFWEYIFVVIQKCETQIK